MKILHAFLIIGLAIIARPVVADEPDPSHPFLTERFQLAVGVFARTEKFKIGAGGVLPDDEIEFGDVFGLDGDGYSESLTFRWKFGKKWSVWRQAWKVQSSNGKVLTKDVEWQDLVFKAGSFANGGVENSIVRLFFGRNFSVGTRHEFGMGAGLHLLDIKAGKQCDTNI